MTTDTTTTLTTPTSEKEDSMTTTPHIPAHIPADLGPIYTWPQPSNIDLYTGHVIKSGRSRNTANSYGSDLRRFGAWVEKNYDFPADTKEVDIDSLGQSWLEQEADDGKKNASLRRYRSSVMGWAKWAGYGEIFQTHRAPPKPAANPHPLEGGMGDIETLLNACRTQNEANLINLCGYMGLRVDEACNAMGEDFRGSGDSTTLLIHGKGSKEREIPVPAGLINWSDFYNGTTATVVSMANSTARSTVVRIGRRVGIKLSSHDLRATFATDMYDRTKDIVMVQKFLGHATPETTMHYVKMGHDAMRAAMVSPSSDDKPPSKLAAATEAGWKWVDPDSKRVPKRADGGLLSSYTDTLGHGAALRYIDTFSIATDYGCEYTIDRTGVMRNREGLVIELGRKDGYSISFERPATPLIYHSPDSITDGNSEIEATEFCTPDVTTVVA